MIGVKENRQSVRLVYVAIALTMALVACGENQPSGSNTPILVNSSVSGPATVTGDTMQWSIPANAPSLVSVQTLPFAVCLLRSATETAGTTKLYADDAGIVRVHLQPSATDINLTSDFVLDCKDDTGLSKSFPLQVRVGSDSVAATSNRFLDSTVVHGAIRPALKGDPDAPSAQELLAGNYPLRPSRKLAPESYRDWLKLVSAQTTIVSSRLTATEERFRTEASHTWSGSYLDNLFITSRAVVAFGTLTVPSIPPATSCPATTCEAAFWLGMDGRTGAPDVVQAGIDFQQTKSGQLWFSSFNIFIEWAPNGAFLIPSLVVNRGDQIFLDVSVTDSTGHFLPPPIAANTPGVKANFDIWNSTSGATYHGSLPMPSGITFEGSYAEWIVERPLNGMGLHWPLAKFNPVTFTRPTAQLFSGGSLSFSNSETTDLNLTDSSGSGQILAQGTHSLVNNVNYATTTWAASGTIF
jgi:hypothetical protein